jgi:hypothetical protein
VAEEFIPGALCIEDGITAPTTAAPAAPTAAEDIGFGL